MWTFTPCLKLLLVTVICCGLSVNAQMQDGYSVSGEWGNVHLELKTEFEQRFMDLRNDFKRHLDEMYETFMRKHETLSEQLLKSQSSIAQLQKIIEHQNVLMSDLVHRQGTSGSAKKKDNVINQWKSEGFNGDSKMKKHTQSVTRLFADPDIPVHVKGSKAFSVYLTHDEYNLSHEYVMRFNGSVLNDGMHYTAVTGHYTAPANGTYVFHYHITTSSDSRPCIASLMVDGVQYSSAYSDPRKQNSMGGNSVIVRLTEGQLVWVENKYDNCDYIGKEETRTTSFSGFFLG